MTTKMKTDQSAALFERAKRVSPGGVHSPVRAFKGVGGIPRFIERAQGVELTDVDGNRYLDFCMSWGPLIFGHQDPEVSEVVRAALSRGWSYGTAEPYSLELAELITGSIPWVEKIRFVNSGTEAVMSALRVARAATGRNKILKFDGCYHGHLDGLLVRAGSGLAEMASPDSAGVPPHVAADTLVVPLNDREALDQMMDKHGHEIAVIAIEPVPANNGLLIQTELFLKHVAARAKKAGALLLFDEVITGFRTAFGGMAERTEIRPDLVCYGKVIGGGFPVGAYGGRRDLLDLVAPAGPVYQAGTLSGNPVAMCAGIATLKKLKRENPFSRLELKCEQLALDLESIARARSPYPIQVQRFASMFWLVLGPVHSSGKNSDSMVRALTEIPSSQKENFAKLFHLLLDDGIYLAPSGFEVSFLSTAHSQSDFDRLCSAFERSLQNVSGAE